MIAHLLGIRLQGVEKCKKVSDTMKSQFKNSIVHGNDHSISNVQTNTRCNSVANANANASQMSLFLLLFQ